MNGSFDDEVFERQLIQLGESFGLRNGRHVVEAEAETKLFQLLGLVLDGRGVEHRHVLHRDPLPDETFAPETPKAIHLRRVKPIHSIASRVV